jgi:hypothetical protein
LLKDKFVNIFFKDLKYKTLVSGLGDWKKKNILIKTSKKRQVRTPIKMYNEFLKLNSTKTSKLKNGQVF